MDTQYQSLVYHQHPTTSFPAGGQSYSSAIQSSPLEMSWQATQSPLNSTSTDHTMYSTAAISRSNDHVDYATHPVPYMPRHPPTNAHQQSQSFNSRESPRLMSFDSSQIESSIGPTRVLTRRRARAAENEPAGSSSPSQEDYLTQQQSAGYPSAHHARPQSPSGVQAVAPYSEQPEREPAAREHAMTRSSHSLFPLTPVSAPLAYSPYTYYPSHPSHSRSTSGSHSNDRSASPALSVASALTSVSSSTSTPNSQNLSGQCGTASPSVTRPKHRKQRLYNVDRKKICVYHRDHANVKQEEIARIFGVERSTISKILKHKTKWLNVPEETPVLLARQRPTKFPYLELRLEKWLRECHNNKTVFTDALIRDKAKEIARELDWPEEKFKASSGWVENFKHRHGIRKGVWHGYGKNTTQSAAVGLGPGYAPGGYEYDDMDTAGQLTSNFSDAYGVHNGIRTDPSSSMGPPPMIDHDLGNESEDDDDNGHRGTISLQPAWQTNNTSSGISNPGGQATENGIQSPIPYVEPPCIPDDPHRPLPEGMPLPAPIPIPLRRDNGEVGGEEVAFVIPAQPTYRPDVGIPNINDAEDAIDKVIAFVDAKEDFITFEERTVLASIKSAIFNLAGGIPYQRDT